MIILIFACLCFKKSFLIKIFGIVIFFIYSFFNAKVSTNIYYYVSSVKAN